jgi:hypothetical protein
VATLSGALLAEIVLTCSDAAEHRRRVEGRLADIAGHVVPDWASVIARPSMRATTWSKLRDMATAA